MKLAKCSPLMMSPMRPMDMAISRAGAAMSARRPMPGKGAWLGSPANGKSFPQMPRNQSELRIMMYRAPPAKPPRIAPKMAMPPCQM